MNPTARSGLSARLGVVMLAALISGSIANLVFPAKIAWVRDWDAFVESQAQASGIGLVTLEETRRFVSAGTHILFDARPPVDYGAAHIPGALSLPSEQMEAEFENFRMILTPDQPILVYCSGKQCDESIQLGDYLIEEGFTNVVLFPGGYNEWEAGVQP